MKTRAWAVIGLIAFLGVLALWCGTSQAQTACTVGGTTSCFTASKTTGAFPIATTLTWNAVGATSCTAGGAGAVAAWSGSVPVSGTRNLTGINVDMHLTLTCALPTGAALQWTAVTTNTDGSVLTNLAGYRVVYGPSATSLTQIVDVGSAGATTFTVNNLAAGTWFFGVKAYTATGLESAVSNVVSKAVAAGQYSAFVDIDGTALPSAPTGLTVTDVTASAFEIYQSGTSLVAHRIGVVRPGSVCASEGQQVVAGVTYSRVDRALVDMDVVATGPDKWVATVYAKCA
jgi:hypothetical protein